MCGAGGGGVLLRLLGVPAAVAIADYLLRNDLRRPWLQEREDIHRLRLAERRVQAGSHLAPAWWLCGMREMLSGNFCLLAAPLSDALWIGWY